MAKDKTISFRLGGAGLQRLETKATELGISVGECARRLVVDGLQANPTEHISDEIESGHQQIMGELKKMDANLRISTLAILIEAGDAEMDEAEKFLQDNWK
jgi:hypothetical protein